MLAELEREEEGHVEENIDDVDDLEGLTDVEEDEVDYHPPAARPV